MGKCENGGIKNGKSMLKFKFGQNMNLDVWAVRREGGCCEASVNR